MKKNFTVAMSVYKNDNPQDFKTAVHSVYIDQTVRPSEIIIVEDGPIPVQLENAVNELCKEIAIIKVLSFEENRGHAAARQCGLEAASNDLVAIMDADDIAVPDRFEKQLKAFNEHPDVAVIGGNINEFVRDRLNVVGRRIVPENDSDIKKYLKSRCPLNLVTVMYKKSIVQAVGGFIDWYCEEDYYLWIRLAIAGHKFYNVQENFVDVRVGEQMYQRRGGMSYFKSEVRLQRYMLNHKIISIHRYVYNIVVRFVVQVAMPNRLRGWVFQKFARK
ncbi:MAG: glycosyltransferase [Bacteroidales bacterium]|nr:glycosyltransferase [Bacteroidales bacterium]